MAEIVTIKPKSGSKRFKAIRGQMTQFQKISSEDGQVQDRQAGEYKRERFPNSRQMFRPIWSNSMRRWKIGNYTGEFSSEKQKELNELVKGCKFKYPEKHPRGLQYIEQADIFDLNDPFFNHRSLRVISKEGEITLDKERPMDRLILWALGESNQFEKAGEENNAISARSRYVITDKNVDTKIKRKARTTAIKATNYFEELSDDKRMKIAMSMGLISNDKVDRGVIDDILWDASQDKKTKINGKTTRQELFIKMCEASSEEINTRNLIQRAKASGNLKKNKSQGYLMFGESIGRTEKQVYEYFSNPENQEMLIRLEQTLEND